MKSNTNSPLLRSISVLFAVLWMLTIYTFLHEGGHALFAVIFGAKIQYFDINFLDFNARVHWDGSLTDPQRAIVSIAGMAVPLLVWAIVMMLVPQKTTRLSGTIRWMASLGIIGSTTPWVIIPLLYPSGSAPAGDDVTRFLDTSGLNPYLLAAISFLLIGGSLLLMRLRAGNFQVVRDFVKQTEPENNQSTWITLAATFTLVVVAALAVQISAPSIIPNQVPKGYTMVNELDLTQMGFTDAVLAEFTLPGEQTAGVLIVFNNVNSNYLDLRLNGSNQFSTSLFHAEGYRSDRDSTQLEQIFPSGTYQVLLTSQQSSSGTIQVYLKK